MFMQTIIDLHNLNFKKHLTAFTMLLHLIIDFFRFRIEIYLLLVNPANAAHPWSSSMFCVALLHYKNAVVTMLPLLLLSVSIFLSNFIYIILFVFKTKSNKVIEFSHALFVSSPGNTFCLIWITTSEDTLALAEWLDSWTWSWLLWISVPFLEITLWLMCLYIFFFVSYHVNELFIST